MHPGGWARKNALGSWGGFSLKANSTSGTLVLAWPAYGWKIAFNSTARRNPALAIWVRACALAQSS